MGSVPAPGNSMSTGRSPTGGGPGGPGSSSYSYAPNYYGPSPNLYMPSSIASMLASKEDFGVSLKDLKSGQVLEQSLATPTYPSGYYVDALDGRPLMSPKYFGGVPS